MKATRYAAIVLAILLVLSLITAEALAEPTPSVSGFGKLDPGRTFAFTAHEKDGVGTGTGVIVIPGIVRFTFDIDCLEVDGNVATMSGKIGRLAWLNPDIGDIVATGNLVWFQAVDNGEGANAGADYMSKIEVWAPGEPNPELYTCTSDALLSQVPLQEVLDGNIQVKP